MHSNRPGAHWVAILSIALMHFMEFPLPVADAYSVNGSLLIGPQQINDKYGKYTIDDLMIGKYAYKVSDDIYMDPCKSSMY